MKIVGKLNTTSVASDLDNFSDKGSIAPYAVYTIVAMVKEGLVEGDASFIKPNANTTRAEAAVLIINKIQ
jgi:hypothetical protein